VLGGRTAKTTPASAESTQVPSSQRSRPAESERPLLQPLSYIALASLLGLCCCCFCYCYLAWPRTILVALSVLHCSTTSALPSLGLAGLVSPKPLSFFLASGFPLPRFPAFFLFLRLPPPSQSRPRSSLPCITSLSPAHFRVPLAPHPRGAAATPVAILATVAASRRRHCPPTPSRQTYVRSILPPRPRPAQRSAAPRSPSDEAHHRANRASLSTWVSLVGCDDDGPRVGLPQHKHHTGTCLSTRRQRRSATQLHLWTLLWDVVRSSGCRMRMTFSISQ
jgi:hypothetical protein